MYRFPWLAFEILMEGMFPTVSSLVEAVARRNQAIPSEAEEAEDSISAR